MTDHYHRPPSQHSLLLFLKSWDLPMEKSSYLEEVLTGEAHLIMLYFVIANIIERGYNVS